MGRIIKDSAERRLSMSAKPDVPRKFDEDMIVRDDLPRDAFELIHDLAYDHEGRERFQYRSRAQQVLMAQNEVGDCDCPCDDCAIDTGKHCGNPPCDQPRPYGMRINCYVKGHEGGSNCRQCHEG